MRYQVFQKNRSSSVTAVLSVAFLQVSQNPNRRSRTDENLVAGTVAQVQDALVSLDLVILGESVFQLPTLCLLQQTPKRLKTVTHSQAFE